VLCKEARHVIRERNRDPRQGSEHAVDSRHERPAQHLLVVVLARHESPTATGERGEQRDTHVGFEKVCVHDFGPAQLVA
jgi:hypothetical protein